MGAFDSVDNIILPDPDDAEGSAAFRKKWKWDAHEMVILKGGVTAADQEIVQNAASKIAGEGKKRDVELTSGTMRLVLMKVMIVDWTFSTGRTPETRRKVEVTFSAIKRLLANYSTPILEACDEIAAGMTEEEQEDFLPGASEHTVESSHITSMLQRSS